MPASIAAHLTIAVLLIFGLPQSLRQSQEDRPVNVELVPPPKPLEKARPAPKPALPPAQQTKPETPKAADVKSPPPNGYAARKIPSPAMQRVVQFGEKDAGPRESLDGNSPKDGSKTTVEQKEPDKQEPAKPEAANAPKPAEDDKQPSAIPTPDKPRSNTSDAIKVVNVPKLAESKRLFSRSATNSPEATTAMGKIPRELRGGSLCLSELSEQLAHASPPYFPDKVPLSRLTKGNVIEEPEVAFRVNGQWRALSYRCELDADAMKVESFALHVGDLIPPTEWRRLALPSQ